MVKCCEGLICCLGHEKGMKVKTSNNVVRTKIGISVHRYVTDRTNASDEEI